MWGASPPNSDAGAFLDFYLILSPHYFCRLGGAGVRPVQLLLTCYKNRFDFPSHHGVFIESIGGHGLTPGGSPGGGVKGGVM